MENEVTTGRIEQVNIDEQMRSAYIDYSMSVIVSRALPDVRDGFKPVHRRVLYGMDGLGLRHTSQTKTSARIVGEVLGKYHPHGDSSVYDAMARMAQDWSLRYPLVFGQGNFGSMDGDPVAAMRYTEAKLSKLSDEVLADLEKDTVDFQNNFDDSLTEPTVLPTKVPLLLLNGSSGIAVGMATNMAPHNLTECCDAICAYIDNPEITVEVLSVIKELATEDMTMLVVTHEMGFAREVSDKVIFMDDGYIAEQGNAKEVFDNPKSKRLQDFLSVMK